MTPTKRFVLLIAIVLLFAGLIIAILAGAQLWDHPPIDKQSRQVDLTYKGQPVTVKIVCNTSGILILGRPNTIDIEVSILSRSSIAAPSAAPTLQQPGTALSHQASMQPRPPNPSGFNSPDSRFLYMSVKFNGDDLKFGDGTNYTAISGDGIPPSGVMEYRFQVTPGGTSNHLHVNLGDADVNGNWKDPFMGGADWEFDNRAEFWVSFVKYLPYPMILSLVAGLVFLVDRNLRKARAKQSEKIVEAKELAEKNPEKVRYAWQLAQTRLESYFDKNLFQVNLVFWVAVTVMAAGFGIVLWAVNASLSHGDSPGAKTATIAGVITQFLGATFMVLYRSTMQQANDFILVLDRINNVGMAMQVLEQISNDPPAAKDEVRAKIVEHLLVPSHPEAAKKTMLPGPKREKQGQE